MPLVRAFTVFLSAILAPQCLYGQGELDSLTIQGIVLDSETEEPVVSASVSVAKGVRGASADLNGRFQFVIGFVDTLRIRVSCVGYKASYLPIPIKPNQKNVFLYLPIRAEYSRQEAYRVTPPGWNKVDADGKFSFWIPPSFRMNDRVHGVDSFVRQYEKGNALVSFDFGYHATLAPSDLAVKTTMTIIGCREATLTSFTNRQRNPGFPHVIAADFEFPFTFWGEYILPEDRDTILYILHSLQFPENR